MRRILHIFRNLCFTVRIKRNKMTASSSDGSIYTAALAHSAEPAGMLQGFWLNAGNDIRKMGPVSLRNKLW